MHAKEIRGSSHLKRAVRICFEVGGVRVGRCSDLRGSRLVFDREIMSHKLCSQCIDVLKRCMVNIRYGRLLIMFDKIQVLQATDTLLSAFPSSVQTTGTGSPLGTFKHEVAPAQGAGAKNYRSTSRPWLSQLRRLLSRV